ncbi:hypothetical protein LTR50_006780 [Elasticomyces elasticus]|nr:hypothetical protein LTR50_006780 [Elasticomyces elasticus]
MSTAAPPVPLTIPNDLNIPVSPRPATFQPGSGSKSQKASRQWRHAVGLLLLLLTIVLWTASNFLASTIFADDTYSKPYLVTYINTAFFLLPLVPSLAWRVYKDPVQIRGFRDVWVKRFRRYQPVRQEDEASMKPDSPLERPRRSVSASSERLLEREMGELHYERAEGQIRGTEGPLNLQEITRLSLEFCFLWFLANYSVAACLEYTTVASSTILTSTSSIFTLAFGALFRVERFSYRKLLGVLASLSGIVLISSVDLSKDNNDDSRGSFPHKSHRQIAIGDLLAFLSAVMYGIYAVFMKKRVGDETRVSMPLFFGFVGLFNVILLWPGLIILHFTGVETFELPPSRRVLAIIIVNSVSSLVADLAWAYAVLLTSPIVVTVGLSMTIPLSLIGQIVLNSQSASFLYWLGACVVVLSFAFVNSESTKESSAVESSREGSSTVAVG